MEFNIEVGKPVDGFTFPLKGKDFFVITDRKNKTESLARKILRKLMLPENPNTVRELLYYMQKAHLKIIILENVHRCMWEIYGDDWGGRGSFVDDGNTIVFPL